MLTRWSDAARKGLLADVGWSGGPMDSLAEFGGPKPRTGNDSSNTSMLIALKQMRKTGVDDALVVEAGLRLVQADMPLPAGLLRHCYLQGGTKVKQARALGLDYEAYCVMIDAAMHALASKLRV